MFVFTFLMPLICIYFEITFFRLHEYNIKTVHVFYKKFMKKALWKLKRVRLYNLRLSKKNRLERVLLQSTEDKDDFNQKINFNQFY